MAILRGTSGDDTIAAAGVSAGVLGGLPGIQHDDVFGSAGHDLIDGGGGAEDAIDYSELAGPVAVTFDAIAQTATVDKGMLGADTLLGAWYGFVLGAGADRFTTLGAPLHNAAAVTGGAGDDSIDGGPGRVIELRYTTSPTGVVVDLAAGTAADGFGGTDSLGGIWALRGSDHGDSLAGSAEDETFYAGLGDDTVDGRGGTDRLIYDPFGRSNLPGILAVFDAPGSGSVAKPQGGPLGNTDHFTGIERIEATAGRDTLLGSGGDDSLDGGMGDDLLAGGLGNDVFFIDSQGDVVNEAVDAGTDTVVARISHYLEAEVENLRLTSFAFFGVGNTLANTLTGTVAANLLLGGDGADTLDGGDGADQLFGEAGADHLLGGSGIDYLFGGNADDTLDGGADADALYGEAGADLLLAGAGFVTDILTGGEGNDTLDAAGGLGDYDLLDGGAGDDTYRVDSPADLTFEAAGGGTDTVIAEIALAGIYLWPEVENLVLLGATPFGVGNELANRLTGSGSANWLLGGAGDDTLEGRGGDDVLFGQGGADSFTFAPGNGLDLVADYDGAADRLVFQGFGAVFVTGLDGGAAVINFRDAGGGLLGDVVLLQGAVLADGTLRLGSLDVGTASLGIVAAGGIEILGGITGGTVVLSAGGPPAPGLTSGGSISLSGGTLTLTGGTIHAADAPPEPHILIG